MSRPAPIERFIGVANLSRGPFALLALPVGHHDDASVQSALQRQLARIDAHPEHATAEADEVRLALHVAAAQLRDPQIREALISRIARAGQRPAEQPQRDPDPGGWPAPAIMTTVEEQFDDIVQQLLAHSGGWNERTRLRIAAMAHVHGLSQAALHRSLRRVSLRQHQLKRTSQRDQGAPLRHVESHGESESAETRRRHHADANVAAIPPVRKRYLLAVAMIGLFISAGVMTASVVSIELGRHRSALAAPGDRPIQRPPTLQDMPGAVSRETDRVPVPAGPGAGSTAPTSTTSASTGTDGPALLQSIQRVRAELAGRPDAAAEEFERALTEVASHWAEFDTSLIVPLQGAIIEYIHQAARHDPELALDAVHTISELALPLGRSGSPLTRSQVLPVVWCVGMLTRLQRDQTFPASVQTAIDQSLRRIVEASRLPRDPTFWTGAEVALDAMIDRLMPGADRPQSSDDIAAAWRHWITAVRGIAQYEPAASDALVLAAADRMLSLGEDPSIHQPTSVALELLLEAIDWSQPKPRQRLLAWFDDAQGITESELNLITRWLVQQDAIDDLPLDMVLSAGAGPVVRSEMRDRYAAYLGLPLRRTEQKLLDRWITQAQSALTSSPRSAPSIDYLQHAAHLARLNAVAISIWQHDDFGADQAMRLADAPIGLPLSGKPAFDPGILTQPAQRSDGAWARDFLSMPRNQDYRLRLLADLRQVSEPIGPADADVLVEAAYYGSPRAVRDAAADVVRQFGEQPTIIYAMLEALPDAPRTEETRQLVQDVTAATLPAIDDPDWQPDLRRTLIAAVANMLAAGIDPEINHFALHIAEAYEDQIYALQRQPMPDQPRPAHAEQGSGAGVMGRSIATGSSAVVPVAGRAAHESATWLIDHWMAEAAAYRAPARLDLSLDDLARRRAGRVSMAADAVQTFAAQQVSLAEVLAYLVAAERPSQVEAVQLTLETMADQRRDARHIFQQIKAAEHAVLRLWLIRLGWEGA